MNKLCLSFIIASSVSLSIQSAPSVIMPPNPDLIKAVPLQGNRVANYYKDGTALIFSTGAPFCLYGITRGERSISFDGLDGQEYTFLRANPDISHFTFILVASFLKKKRRV
jgi:hypothetical protein